MMHPDDRDSIVYLIEDATRLIERAVTVETKEELDLLRRAIGNLKTAISLLQGQFPAS